MERRESMGTVFRRQMRESLHLQSPSLEDLLSPLQVSRQAWEPTLPWILRSSVDIQVEENEAGSNLLSQDDTQTALAAIFPLTYGKKIVNLISSPDLKRESRPPLRIGVVLSGGQAPGGHNVIAGIYDYIKEANVFSQLFGFLGGPHGAFTHNYIEITDDLMDRFRNQGGFHMIRSGRHKIETEEQKQGSLEICNNLDLNGLTIIGGDDSNTNAAVLAEYFLAHGSKTNVIGCPKTIDGDLRNMYIEASFGFDTAVKTYIEFIGNLCIDVATSGKYYHFVRLMGRSASHISLECAFQTRPNFVLIGEEVLAKGITLKEIVNEIVEMVINRHKLNRNYGIILLPEGLIEFIPEMRTLIMEINKILASEEFAVTKLSIVMRELFESLPISTQEQLLLERDPHGNVQVAMIATEKLLISMVENELIRQDYTDCFQPLPHYFGYEGRSGLPTNFDANYCYALGHVSAVLIDKGYSSYMARLCNLKQPVAQWLPGGCPFTRMMTIEKRKGKDVPVIKKYLVDLESDMFKLFVEVRKEWKYRDLYRSPGPIQFEGPLADVSNFSIVSPIKADLLPPKCIDYDEAKSRHHFVKSREQMSALECARLDAPVIINSVLKHPQAVAVVGNKVPFQDPETQKVVLRDFPMQCRLSGHCLYDVEIADFLHGARVLSSNSLLNSSVAHPLKVLRIGVALTGQQAPGVANVLWGLFERVRLSKGALIGFKAGGLFNGLHIEITEKDMSLCWNQGGFSLLGRQTETESFIATPEGVESIRKTCNDLLLDGLVIIGGRWALSDMAILTEYFLQNNVKTKVVGVPATQNNNIDSNFLECTIGFDTASKCYSHLVGNLLTDAASATKYWYFVRLMGRDKSHMVLEASLQSHPNVTLVSESYAAGDKTLEDVVLDIADVICARSENGKNFGTVVIPEGLLSELPQMRHLLHELNKLWSIGTPPDKAVVEDELVKLHTSNKYTAMMSPWSLALLKSLPEFIRRQLVQPRSVGRYQFSKIATEELICRMVASELQLRRKAGAYSGVFSPVCLYLGYQARSSLPSQFDCAMGLSHGYLAAISIESGLTGYVTSIRGLCGPSSEWRPSLFPVTAILRMQHDELYALKVAMVPSDMVKLEGKALQKIKMASPMWEKEDRFCNPGPIQFFGHALYFYSRYLFEQQHEYLKMLSEITAHLTYLTKTCTFGIDERSLRTSCITLHMLREILSNPQDGETCLTRRRTEDDYTRRMSGFIPLIQARSIANLE